MSTPTPPEDGWPEPDAPTRVGATPPPPPPMPPGEPPADRRIGAGMLLALGAIALVALGVLIAYLLTHKSHHNAQTTTTTPPVTTATLPVSGGVKVPDVRNVKVAQAESILKAAGFQVRTSPVGPQPGQSSGTVVSESPTPDTKVAKGSQVLLTVARGNATTTTGSTATTTTTATTTGTATTTTAATTTSPAATTPANATVPDLSGQNEASAATALGKAGLLASLVFVPSSDELGTVEAQGKSAGTTVPYHAHVQVNVSTGPGNKPQETVPNVIGKTLKDALSSINGANLRLIYLRYPVSSKSQAGKIVQQTPLGNGHAPQNAQVIVYLASYQG